MFGRRRPLLLVGLVLLASATIVALRAPVRAPVWEEHDYIAIAEGHPEQATYYYGGRVLHPLAVRAMAALTHASIPEAFVIMAAVALVAFLVGLGVQLTLAGVPAAIILVSVLNLRLLEIFRAPYRHELFYAALLTMFFLALRANLWASLPLLFLLHLTRESSLVLTAVIIAVAIRRGRKTFALAAGVVGGSGILTTTLVFNHAAVPNPHHIVTVLFYPLKLAYDATYNAGFIFWTNTVAANLGRDPKWTIALPAWLHLGTIRAIGYCGFDAGRLASTAVALASSFGAMPLVLLHSRGRLRSWSSRQPLWLVVALVYGVVGFLLIPLIGTEPYRYAFYAWPAFLLVSPMVLIDLYPRSIALQVAGLSLTATLLPLICYRLVTGEVAFLVVLLLLVPLFLIAWSRLQTGRRPPLATAELVSSSNTGA